MALDESRLQQIYNADEIYRPPIEAESILVEVARGCSWGKCLFCDYRNDDFTVRSLNDIERQLAALAEEWAPERGTRIFLMGCNPLSLPARYLADVLRLVYQYMPFVTDISMYARADDVLKKGLHVMESLRDAGVSSLHIGIESGCDEVLKLHNKGETVSMFESALGMLDRLEIGYHLTIIPGLGGVKLSSAHAAYTASLLSRVIPLSVWCIALKVWDNTPLRKMADSGEFEPMTYREILEEERLMIEAMNVRRQCLYVDSTALGKYTVMAMLPERKEWLLGEIDRMLRG